MTDEQRFWAKVDRRGPGECWLWTAARGRNGYGTFHTGGSAANRRTVYVHRWVYENTVGPISDGLTIDHLCRNRRCVNPAHLEPVTHAENRRRARGFPYRRQDPGPVCRAGHPRTPENTGVNSAGARFCRPCHREAVRRCRRKFSSAA